MAAATLDIERQIKYWQRNLKTLLPTEYTATDSSRGMLGYLILAALDLLGVGVDTLPTADVKGFRAWILNCQHPSGGFCGSPNHKYPKAYYSNDGRDEIDPANLPATFFAILVLGFVGKLANMDRNKCLRWLKKLQRADGSFGEMLGGDGEIQGGKDMRYAFFAAGVRYLLRGDLGPVNGEEFEDIDVDRLVRYIRLAETYDGGVAESPEHEAHAGYTYNAIAALSFLGRLPESAAKHNVLQQTLGESGVGERGLSNLHETIRWLLSREVTYSSKVEEEYTAEQGYSHIPANSQPNQRDSTDISSLAALSIEETQYVGFNGRLNKLVDTCYCFWVSASLEILGKGKLINQESTRRFLLDRTQHRIGGFGKQPGSPPDLYHSYLGLATLAMMREPGLKEVDPVLCMSIQARENLEESIKEATIPVKMYWKHGYPFMSLETDPHHTQRMEEDEGPPQYLIDRLQGMANQAEENLQNGTNGTAHADTHEGS